MSGRWRGPELQTASPECSGWKGRACSGSAVVHRGKRRDTQALAQAVAQVVAQEAEEQRVRPPLDGTGILARAGPEFLK